MNGRAIEELLDLGGYMRYGMPTAEKEALAARGSLPGAPVDRTADLERANRYASGYQFAETWPTLAPILMPAISALKTSSVPLLGGSSRELQGEAERGMTNSLVLQALRRAREQPVQTAEAGPGVDSYGAWLRRMAGV